MNKEKPTLRERVTLAKNIIIKAHGNYEKEMSMAYDIIKLVEKELKEIEKQ